MIVDGTRTSFFKLDCWISCVKTESTKQATLISQSAFRKPSQFKIGMNYANLLPQQQRITKLMTESELKKITALSKKGIFGSNRTEHTELTLLK